VTILAGTPQVAVAKSTMLPRIDPISRLPVIVLFPHSRCNCRCRMCDIWRATGRSEMSVSEIVAWADDWSRLGVTHVALSGGEALMHSDIEAVCEKLNGAGFRLTVMTTGLLLERHAGWLPQYVDDVVVSLDGPEAIHNEIRGVPRAFEKLRRGVSALRAAGPRVAISARCVVQRANYRFLRQTVAAARSMGLDRISFLAVDTSSEAFNRPGGWDDSRTSEVALTASDLPIMDEEIGLLVEEMENDFSSGFIAESPAKLHTRLLDYFRAVAGTSEFPPVRCNAPWVSCVVEADGTVRPCYFQPAYGNVKEAASLEALLNGPPAIAFRNGLDVRTDPICKRCVCSLALQEE
jgi:Fe-coproporphyrin III synthase